jgi:ribosome-interacting GTPase 1
MDFQGSKVQLVEVPALVKGSSEGKANGLQLLSIARNADAVVLLARNSMEEQLLLQELGNVKIFLNEKKPAIEIQQSKFKGIAIVHKQNLKTKEALLHDFLHARGMYNVSVVLNQQLRDLLTVERVLDETIAYKQSITVDAFGQINFGELRQKIFGLLNKILVFTKKTGQPPEMNAPLALPAGTTVADAAKTLHKDFANFKFVRVWGSSKFPGQRVEHNFELRNGDIIEICA